jgi:hypothetical protein
MPRIPTCSLFAVVTAIAFLTTEQTLAEEPDATGEPVSAEQGSVDAEPGAEVDADEEPVFDYGELEEDVVAEMEAEEATAELEEGAAPSPGRVQLDLGFYLRSDRVGTLYELSPLLSGAFRVIGGLSLTLDWGFGFLENSPDAGEAESVFVVGNPFFSALWATQQGRTELRYGVGFAVPFSSVPEEGDVLYLEKAGAYYYASAMRGRYDHWLWMPEHAGIVLRGGGEMVSPDHIFLGGDAALAVLIPSGDYHDHTASIYLQGAGEIGFGFGPGEFLFFDAVKMVARLQLVSIPVGEDDGLQVSLGPCGRAEIDGWFLDGSFIFNFDKPDGIYGDGRDIWGLQLGGGRVF